MSSRQKAEGGCRGLRLEVRIYMLLAINNWQLTTDNVHFQQ